MSEQDMNYSPFEVGDWNPLLRGELCSPMDVQTIIFLYFTVDWSVDDALVLVLITSALLLLNAK